MSRSRRLVLLILGFGACVVLVLQSVGMEMWSPTPSPRLRNEDATSNSQERNSTEGTTVVNRTQYPADQLALVPATSQANAVAQNTISPVKPADVQEPSDPQIAENSIDDQAVQKQVPVFASERPDPAQNQVPVLASERPGPVQKTVDLGPGSPYELMVAQARKDDQKPRNDLKPPRSILGPEQLLQIMGSAIGSLPVQNPKKVTHVLVTTYFRSGSTFLGDILQQNWKTFYHFEPLHHMSDGLRIKDAQVPEALSLLKDLMYCNFTSPLASKYLLWASDQHNTFLMRRNRFLWVACRMQPNLCFRPDFVNFVCVRSPWQVMKVNRLSLQQVGQFVLDNPELDIKVLHLVRDPRGIISSRKVLSWCNTTSCSDFRVLCNEMNSDYEVFQKLQRIRPDRFFQLRYEDLSMNPQPVSEQMLGSLGVPYTNTVRKFLKLNTKARAMDNIDPYSTRRDSSRTPFEWRKKLKLDEIKKLQIGCTSVLKNYEYALVNSSQQLIGDPTSLYSSGKSLLRT